jgi:YVTN family beta-propeller protein
MKTHFRQMLAATVCLSVLLLWVAPASSQSNGYHIFVSNEHSGTVTVINGADFTVTTTIPSANVRAASTPARTEKSSMSR